MLPVGRTAPGCQKSRKGAVALAARLLEKEVLLTYFTPLAGGCTCSEVHYRLEASPLFVHCCHCTWCQRETGSAFAINALIEADRVRRTSGTQRPIRTPSASGQGQTIWRCPTCLVARWSTYPDAGPAILFLRVGTLDEPGQLPPDIHIYTATKLSWVTIPESVPAVAEYYKREDFWPADSTDRYRATRERQHAGQR